jgi:hypothetical protein
MLLIFMIAFLFCACSTTPSISPLLQLPLPSLQKSISLQICRPICLCLSVPLCVFLNFTDPQFETTALCANAGFLFRFFSTAACQGRRRSSNWGGVVANLLLFFLFFSHDDDDDAVVAVVFFPMKSQYPSSSSLNFCFWKIIIIISGSNFFFLQFP